jgi:hypothetical protein
MGLNEEEWVGRTCMMHGKIRNPKCWLENLKEIQSEPEKHEGLILRYIRSRVYRTHPAYTDDL